MVTGRGFRTAALLCALAGAALIETEARAREKARPEGQTPGTRSAPADGGPAVDGDPWTRKRLTGDWGGFRTRLEDAGIRVKVKLMNQVMVNMRNGRETTNGHDFAGSYELNFTFDLDEMGLVPGASFFLRGKGTWGGGPSGFDREKVGALFKTNQDAGEEKAIFVDKWWWEQDLFDERVMLRLGRQEPVKDLFDTSRIMGHEDKQFMNRALVRNATIPPDKGLGLFVHAELPATMYVRAAAVDAHAENYETNFNTAFHDEDEFRFYAEVGAEPEWPADRGGLWGHYRVGTWYDPVRKRRFIDDLGGRRADRFESGDWGFFCGLDQMVWKEREDPEDDQGVAVAARYGFSDGDVNRIDEFWAVAAQYEGLIPGRDEDVLGVGVARGILSDAYRHERPDADRETVYEMYYAIHLAPWLVISPDVQYIRQAGGGEDAPDAFVGGIRVYMGL